VRSLEYAVASCATESDNCRSQTNNKNEGVKRTRRKISNAAAQLFQGSLYSVSPSARAGAAIDEDIQRSLKITWQSF
jgi:hypothetical protein